MWLIVYANKDIKLFLTDNTTTYFYELRNNKDIPQW